MTKIKSTGVAIALLALVFTGSNGHAQGDDKSNQQQGQELQMNKQSSQTDVSDEELEKFSKVMKSVQQLRQKQMPKMRQALKDAGLTMKEYRSIQRKMGGSQGGAMQGSNSKDTKEPSKEQKQKYQKAQKKIRSIQKSMKQKMGKRIKENGLTRARFEEISKAVRADKELQQKLRKMQGGPGGQRGGQPRGR